MKITQLIIASLCAGLALSASAGNLPLKAMSWSMPAGGSKWVVQSQATAGNALTTQLVREGASAADWQEMILQQTTFTDASVARFVELYTADMAHNNRGVQLTQTLNADASITVSFTSGGTTSVRRFMRGTDGIYMLAYYSRSANPSADVLAIWRGVIDGAGLVPNPERKS